MVDIDKRVWPQPLLQFLPCHHFARMLQEDRQNLKGLASELQFHPALAHFSGWKVNFEGSEPD